MSALTGQQAPTLWDVCDAWLRRATVIIDESADALNTMNVFPVSDADTGSNLKLTLAGIAQAVPEVRVVEAGSAPTLDPLVRAAVLSAHGNSGAIVAEMFVSVCRTLESGHPTLRSVPPGAFTAMLLRTVATAARRAVARPVAGTILTVADEAAAAAERAAEQHPDEALAVATAAQAGAREALAQTTGQLEVLAAAGVVDAGGQAYTLLLDVLVEVLGGPAAEPLTGEEAVQPASLGESAGHEYEVMYVLRDATPAALDALRQRLSELGRSVVIVGDQAMAQVHVHLRDAGAAVEAALGSGELSQIRVTGLPDDPASNERSVISVVSGEGLAEAVTAHGGLPLLAAERRVSWTELAGAVAETCGDVVILPNDLETMETAGRVAAELRRTGRRVAVIPTSAQVQGLAALAVHEPTADFESVVVAMSNAAGHARHGAVTVAEGAAATPGGGLMMTSAGPCRPGDVLGAVGGDVVEIGDSVAEVAWAVVQRMLTSGGELLTLVVGAAAPVSLAADLTDRVRHSSPELDVEVVEGGQPRYLLLLGLE